MFDQLGKPLETPDNEPIRALGDLIFAAHHAAQLKGLWPIDGRPLAESLNNLHADISEGWRQYHLLNGFTELQKLALLWVGVASAAIDLADNCGGECWQPVEEEFDDVKIDLRNLTDVIFASHERITDLGQLTQKNVVASQLFALWFVAAGVADVDLWLVIDDVFKFRQHCK